MQHASVPTDAATGQLESKIKLPSTIEPATSFSGTHNRTKSTLGCTVRHREPPKMRAVDLVGQHFSRLVVIEPAEPRAGKRYWLCRCECGNEIVATGSNLRTGNTNSCGCFQREWAAQRGRESKTHGHWTNGGPSPTYRSWLA